MCSRHWVVCPQYSQILSHVVQEWIITCREWRTFSYLSATPQSPRARAQGGLKVVIFPSAHCLPIKTNAQSNDKIRVTFFFWPCPWDVEFPGLGFEHTSQLCPEPQQSQCQIFNPLKKIIIIIIWQCPWHDRDFLKVILIQ